MQRWHGVLVIEYILQSSNDQSFLRNQSTSKEVRAL